MNTRKSKNRGLYIPEFPTLDKIASIEASRRGEVFETGSMIREWLQKGIKAWRKKNPAEPLDVSR